MRLIQLIHLLFHTLTSMLEAKFCRNFALGHCPQGDQCKYLHSSVMPLQPAYAMAPVAAPTMVRYVAFRATRLHCADSVCAGQQCWI